MKFSKTSKSVLFACALAGAILPARAVPLTLDSCRNLALSNNKELRRADADIEAARYNRKAARTKYLPKISVSGTYMRTGDEVSLLSGDQKNALSNIGSVLGHPELNSVGQGLADALRTDTRNLTAAAAVLTQPIYMGGRIRAYNNIMDLAGEIAEQKKHADVQKLLVEVDETYWNIVSLNSKLRLAESYRELVRKLDSDVTRLIEEGFATKADGLSVKVKVNEADVTIIQIENGIDILRMLMCRLCGLPLESPLTLADETAETLPGITPATDGGSSEWQSRPELQALGKSVRIYDEKVKIARAEFLPTVALTGGYMASYPSVFNSFEKKFKGTWGVGVAVSIPVLTWGERRYKVNAAKAEAAAARFELEETREKIELQVSQCRQRVREAEHKLTVSESSQRQADENLRYATLGMKEGVIPVSNVLEAQTAWLGAKSTLIASQIELRLANVRLSQALGTIK